MGAAQTSMTTVGQGVMSIDEEVALSATMLRGHVPLSTQKASCPLTITWFEAVTLLLHFLHFPRFPSPSWQP